MVIYSSEEKTKALRSMRDTDIGKLMNSSDEQREKTNSSIDLSEVGSVRDRSDEQPSKQEDLRRVISLGRIMDVRLVQSMNTSHPIASPIAVISSGS